MLRIKITHDNIVNGEKHGKREKEGEMKGSVSSSFTFLTHLYYN